MIRPSCASRSHTDAGKKRAVVCSLPPSVVGFGICTSASLSASAEEIGLDDNVGRK